ncbi:T3SS effector NleG family protein [Escherichia albertii]
MPLTTLNIQNISQLSPAEIQSLQDTARRENGLVISSSGWRYSISYVPEIDGFSISAERGGLHDGLSRFQDWLTLERQLNGGVDFSSRVDSYLLQGEVTEYKEGEKIILQNKINSYIFHPNSNHFSCPGSFLICPITLEIPETGVFMRNSQNSDICSLYDKDALLQLIDAGGAHPLSRELITELMIMRQDECHFDSKREAFVVNTA